MRTLRRVFLDAALLGGISVFAVGQDSVPDKAAVRGRLELLKKQLITGDSDSRLRALEELGEIDDEGALSILAARLRTDTPELRLEAVRAIARHRKPAAAVAIGAAIDANREHSEVLEGFIQALAELDLCKGLPFLGTLLWVNKNALADRALDALGKIGCPECAGTIVDFLRQAEVEEKKPDVFEDDEGGSEENRNKNKTLAGLAPKARETLAAVLGRRFAAARDASAWLGAEPVFKLTSVFFCEAEHVTYEVPYGKPKKCGFPNHPALHSDLLLKHVKE